MAEPSLSELPLWNQFEKAARERRRNPVRLLTEYMRECLEVWEDQKLDEEMRSDAAASGYSEEDAVEIVRQHRLEMQRRGSP
jgi:hypothetical protein